MTRELTAEEKSLIVEAGVFAVRMAGSGYNVEDLVAVNENWVAVKGYEDQYSWSFDELNGVA